MKKKRIELDVDFIGDQKNPLTKEESLAISEYIRTQKAKQKTGKKKKTKKQAA